MHAVVQWRSVQSAPLIISVVDSGNHGESVPGPWQYDMIWTEPPDTDASLHEVGHHIKFVAMRDDIYKKQDTKQTFT